MKALKVLIFPAAAALASCTSQVLPARQCGSFPNCVSSAEIRPEHQIPPLASAAGSAAAWSALKEILSSRPRTTLVVERENYLHYEVRSFVFRFVDDVEFWNDAGANSSSRFDLRSASRVGKSDLGVNRKRADEIREAFCRSVGCP